RARARAASGHPRGLKARSPIRDPRTGSTSCGRWPRSRRGRRASSTDHRRCHKRPTIMSFSLRDAAQELYELGPRESLFRAGGELRDRLGPRRVERDQQATALAPTSRGDWIKRLPFADPLAVADAMRDAVTADGVQRLTAIARDALLGRLLCFGRWTADFGDPIDWHLNPRTGRRWPADGTWSPANAASAHAGDVKVTWEAARFQHAYYIARAAAFAPRDAEHYARLLAVQMRAFVAANPPGEGVHGSSGQEVALRLLAWL